MSEIKYCADCKDKTIHRLSTDAGWYCVKCADHALDQLYN